MLQPVRCLPTAAGPPASGVCRPPTRTSVSCVGPLGSPFAGGPPRFPDAALRFAPGPRTGWPSFLGRWVVLPPVVLYAHVCRALCSVSSLRRSVFGQVKADGCLRQGPSSERDPASVPWVCASFWSLSVPGGWVRGFGPLLGRAAVAYQEPGRPLKRQSVWSVVVSRFAACPADRGKDHTP